MSVKALEKEDGNLESSFQKRCFLSCTADLRPLSLCRIASLCSVLKTKLAHYLKSSRTLDIGKIMFREARKVEAAQKTAEKAIEKNSKHCVSRFILL